MDETSLADFLQDETEKTPPDESEPAESASNEQKQDEHTTPEKRLPPTSDWVRDGSECQRCEKAVVRRWRDGDRMVCAECKSWQ